MTKRSELCARVYLRFSGTQLEKLQEVMELLSFNTESEAVRYLASRGLEACSASLRTQRMQKKLEEQYSPQELLPLFEKMGTGTE